MYVSDIIDELVEQSGLCATGPTSVILYKRLTRAVEWLASQGLWDAMQFYLDINVQTLTNADQPATVIILPREVLTPIKINQNRNPSFSRNRLYEFSLSGPGNRGGTIKWEWMEKNTYPLLAFMPTVGSKLVVQGDPADDNKTISFFGLDVDNREISETVTLNHTLQTTENSYAVMRRIRKDVTNKLLPVTLPDTTPIANYYPDETNPRYRVIQLSKKATAVHMLFKCVTLEVKTTSDYIPLDSALAVLHSFRAINLALNSQAGPSDEVDKFQKLALAALQDEQKSRNAAAELAAANEVQPAFNLNINNRDSLIAADVIDDVFAIFGPIGLDKAFDRITDAIELANNKSLSWEGSEGYADIHVGHGGLITLPRSIYRPITINSPSGRPMQMRNRWFEFHLNGPGQQHSHHGRWTPHNWEDVGKAVTVNDPPREFRVVAINDLDIDDGAKIRVYGYDEKGKWIRTPNPDLTDSDDDTKTEEKYIDGYQFEATFGATLPDPLSPEFRRITRITRDETNGYQQLLAYSPDDDNSPILIGYYYPDETEPNYSRIRLPNWHHRQFIPAGPPPDGSTPTHHHHNWVRMRYRKRGLKISHLTDNLHLNSRLAVVDFLYAVKEGADPTKSDGYAEAGKKKMQEAESAQNPSQQFDIQIEENFQSPLAGQY
jgi:hypothetical protein